MEAELRNIFQLSCGVDSKDKTGKPNKTAAIPIELLKKHTSGANIYDNMFSSSLNFLNYSASTVEFQKAFQEINKMPTPSKFERKIMPYTCRGSVELIEKEDTFKEKSLLEMGFETNEVHNWEQIVQPPKDNLYKLLREMLNNHVKSNVQIRIGSVSFNCHMIVLQAYSEFFMKCSNEMMIQLPEERITPGAFMMTYDWMLADKPLVQREGILELFNAATFLRMKGLINQCWLCLDDDERFCEDSAFLLYLEAQKYTLPHLKELMLRRICKFYLVLVASQEFLLLPPTDLLIILQSNNIGINSEIEVFMSVVRWLNHDWSDRQQYVTQLMLTIRFSLMPPWFLVTLNKSTDCPEIDLATNNNEVKKLISDGISYTTTQLFYGANKEEFLVFLEKYNLSTPVQRQWLIDMNCIYHHRLDCPNMQHITYKLFLSYLEGIHGMGRDYWRSFTLAKGNEKSIHCCDHVKKANAAKGPAHTFKSDVN